MKIWSSNEKGDDKVIAYIDGTIYRGNPKPDDVESAVFDLQMKVIPTKNFTAIPSHYLRQIILEDGLNDIEVLFGAESSEHLKISDDEKRKEVFEYFKANIPNAKYYEKHYSKMQAGKKPLIAMAVVTVVFLWTLYIATGIEHGNEYGVTGDRKDSLAGIVLGLAQLGTTNVSLIFCSLLIIAMISFGLKVKNPKIVHRIQIRA